jgi:hypothetical protein
MLLQLSLPLSLRPIAYGESWDTCQHRHPPLRRVQSRARRTRVNIEPLLSSEAGSGVEGHVAAPDPSWMARRGLEPLGT